MVDAMWNGVGPVSVARSSLSPSLRVCLCVWVLVGVHCSVRGDAVRDRHSYLAIRTGVDTWAVFVCKPLQFPCNPLQTTPGCVEWGEGRGGFAWPAEKNYGEHVGVLSGSSRFAFLRVFFLEISGNNSLVCRESERWAPLLCLPFLSLESLVPCCLSPRLFRLDDHLARRSLLSFQTKQVHSS